ncbi:helix-turn-helix domain-containing protein [Streptomyces dioscori]|uniref:hypothetical protein n=1 Tax=Streptomyces dioscori TaxID=2109333 RepID=UPI00131E641E|nr:hypothetical protein [Streptomyces dioscori]
MTDTVGRELIEFTDTRPGYENRDGSFVIVPKKMAQDSNLSDAEYRVLSYLHDKAGNPNPELYNAKNRDWCRIAFPSIETIGNETNRSKRQAQETVTSLDLKGYVKIVHRKTSKGINNVYAVQFPSWYQALNKVNTFTQLVVIGKKAAKRGSAENLPTPNAENRTTSSEENRTVNSSIEIAPHETGTSTELRSEELPEENQGKPLAETMTPPLGGLANEALEEVGSSTLADESHGFAAPISSAGDVVDAHASPPSGATKKRGYSFTPKKRIDRVPAPRNASVRASGAEPEASEPETPQKPSEDVWKPLRRAGESDEDYNARLLKAMLVRDQARKDREKIEQAQKVIRKTHDHTLTTSAGIARLANYERIRGNG